MTKDWRRKKNKLDLMYKQFLPFSHHTKWQEETFRIKDKIAYHFQITKQFSELLLKDIQG